jgi:RNA polymerase-binding transcription factor DksA
MTRESLELIAQLNARRDELTDRLSRLNQEARRSAEPLVADFAEQAVQRENDDVVDRLRETTTAELREVRNALRRVADGTFGRCLHCGSPIEAARLRALPFSSLCMSCVEK